MRKTDDLAKCFVQARKALAREGVALNGGCLEASAEMVCCLRAKGADVRLIRRELPYGRGGHWTVATPQVEVDPTIGFWTTDRPRGVSRGALYIVSMKSPHRRWHRTVINETVALETGLGRRPPTACKRKDHAPT
jgi:hypothetical protein